MQSILNFIGHLINSIVALVVIILILDMVLKNYLAKSGKSIAEIPAGDIVRDTAITVVAGAKSVINIEDKDLMEKTVIGIGVAIFLLIHILVIQ